MNKPILKLAFAALALAMLMAEASAQGLLIINSAQADLSKRTITLSGLNFGSTAPAVNLNAMQLPVTSFSSTAIQATLPVGLGPGSYHLVVTSSSRTGLLGRDDR